MKRLLLISLVFSLISINAFAQSSGTPSQLRVITDSNGYLAVIGAAQTPPTTQSTFSSTRLKTDTNGYLYIVLASGSTIPAPGSDTQVIFNDGGVLGADAGFVYNKTTDTATLGILKVGNGTAGAESITFAGDTDTGLFWGGSNSVVGGAGGVARIYWDTAVLQVKSDLIIGWSSSTVGSSTDLALRRGAAGKLSITTATSTNGVCLDASTDAVLYVFADDCSTAGAVKLDGNLTVGGSYIGTGDIQVASTSTLYWNTRSQITSPADGKSKFRNAADSTNICEDYSTDATDRLYDGDCSGAATLAVHIAAGQNAVLTTVGGVPTFQAENDARNVINPVGLRGSTVNFYSNGNTATSWTIDTSENLNKTGANGQLFGVQSLTELTTIAAAATTDTTIQIPANATVVAVSVRVTTTIPTAATFTVGDAGNASRYSTTTVSTTAGSTDPGTKFGANWVSASALAIRITPNATPAANTGRVRVTIYYILVTPPTS